MRDISSTYFRSTVILMQSFIFIDLVDWSPGLAYVHQVSPPKILIKGFYFQLYIRSIISHNKLIDILPIE